MYYEEYGSENQQCIVFLHAANYVHVFDRQYELSSKYHLYIPHIMGYGKEADKVFSTDKAVESLVEFIENIEKKVLLVGFSLGAQLGYSIVSKRPDLLNGAILISPWLIKEEPMLSKVVDMNIKQLKLFQNKAICSFIGLVNGMNKEMRQEFVNQMQQVSIETVTHVVDNNITLESQPDFSDANIPILALAGGKEQMEVTESVKKMSKINPNCQYEIWSKAAHNIPPMYSKQLIEKIESYMK